MTEDETFLKLKRIPWEKVQHEVHNTEIRTLENLENIIHKAGWNVRDYNAEYDKRNPFRTD